MDMDRKGQLFDWNWGGSLGEVFFYLHKPPLAMGLMCVLCLPVPAKWVSLHILNYMVDFIRIMSARCLIAD